MRKFSLAELFIVCRGLTQNHARMRRDTSGTKTQKRDVLSQPPALFLRNFKLLCVPRIHSWSERRPAAVLSPVLDKTIFESILEIHSPSNNNCRVHSLIAAAIIFLQNFHNTVQRNST